ncbi:DUF262 domain-containing protein [uncultured Porphyromonas sp.]|uniref:DUF262 domain-containing protein n=1 Tax=uncultured Porphyromonas sp. TaxID=159274 RepID=UPI0025DA5373|nr:DUF262 domain-containing protein [uncultured Porphyromonas sp.]
MIQELRILDDETLFDKEVHYVIPRYQRAYAWEDKEIVQLIDDINDSTGDYYIGSLVVAKVKGKEETYEVVDGQQRLTTLYLLLHYLVSRRRLEREVGKTLSFDCRPNSNYTLVHIQDLLSKEKPLADDMDRIEQSILNGLKVIEQKFTVGDVIDVEAFIERLKSVILYRIEVPEHTDLNRYFEIMNTRGEQLEQHDILKAKLMGYLSDRREQEFFSRVWNACSDMTGYVQMHFAKAEREEIFGDKWSPDKLSGSWSRYTGCLKMGQSADEGFSITSVTRSDFKVAALDAVRESDNTPIRFDSIIGFPHFLLHVLRVFLRVENVSLSKGSGLGSLLDDKRLLADYNKVIACGQMGAKPIKENEASFARKFILFLLRSRFLFDQFIIKREYAGDDQEGVWSLKELCTAGAGYKKKAYYANTRLRYENEWEKTYAPRNKECLMIQSALRVSYTSPKVMHWITRLLEWLFNNKTERYKLTDEAERIAAEAVKDNFLATGNYELGVQTPHVVFNYLDYLLWKEDKEKYKDFVFEFRNSVEHWYPQHPSDGTIEPWDGRDVFGNLCIISRSVNSKFSNLSPESKMKSYKKMVQKGSLKLRIMGDIIERGTSETWRLSECAKHEEEMISLLCEAVREAIEEE